MSELSDLIMEHSHLSFSSRWLLLGLALSWCLAASSPAQTSPADLVVLSDAGAGTSPRALLLRVSPTTGMVTPLSGFPSDGLEPLCLTDDPGNGDLIVASRAGAAGSRIVRLAFAGTAVVQETVLATLPGSVTDLDLHANGDLYASVEGPSGGIWRVPASGSPPVLAVALPEVTAFYLPYLGTDHGLAAQSSPTGGLPNFVTLDVVTGVMSTTAVPGLAGRRITGLFDIGTAVPRYYLSDDQGQLHVLTLSPAASLWSLPSLGPGAMVDLAVRPFATTATAYVVGDGTAPNVYEVPFQIPFPSPPPILLAGSLPGSPRSMTFAIPSLFITTFGSGCPSASLGWSGTGSVGTAFVVSLLGGVPNFTAHLAVGTSNTQWGGFLLPATLPGNCVLRVAPEVVVNATTNGSGAAALPFMIPNQPALVGQVFFAQWGMNAPGGWLASDALAIQIW